MMFEVLFSHLAKSQFEELESNKTYIKRHKAVSKTIQWLVQCQSRNWRVTHARCTVPRTPIFKTDAVLAQNPRHPSLQTHEYVSLKGPGGEKVFEAYAEQHTPGAYRIFWCYGSKPGQITILAITPHP